MYREQWLTQEQRCQQIQSKCVAEGAGWSSDSQREVQNCGPQLFPIQKPKKQQWSFQKLSLTVGITTNLEILYC
jgi:hypothetical protein